MKLLEHALALPPFKNISEHFESFQKCRTLSEVSKTFRKLSLQVHPDKTRNNPTIDEKNRTRMAELNSLRDELIGDLR